jgi:hypothetical protein
LLDSVEEKRGQVANFVENALVSLLKSGKLSTIKKRRGRRPNKISRRRSAFESKNVLFPPWASLRASLLPAIFPRFRFFSLFFCRRRVFPSGRFRCSDGVRGGRGRIIVDAGPFARGPFVVPFVRRSPL